MRILMVARSTLNSSPGGDTVQIMSTAAYLRKLGVNVDVALSNSAIEYQHYDLLHFFNVIRPDDIITHTTRSNLPYVISTIYVEYSEFEKSNRKFLIKILANVFSDDQLEYLKAIGRYFINGDKIQSAYYLIHGQKKTIKFLVRGAKMLLPNSRSEYERFLNKYKVPCRFAVIANAVDKSIFNANVVPHPLFKDHVLCVGRVEGRKNQLNLIKALKGTDLKLTIIGKPSPNHTNYYNECLKLADDAPNINFVSHVTHVELASIYKAAKVHVLPSWFETTGLSSLEAGLMGCNIVVTKKGDTEEYFEDMVYYCDPDDISSIKTAVVSAFNDPVNVRLTPHVLKNYTWERTAEQTRDAYNSVLQG